MSTYLSYLSLLTSYTILDLITYADTIVVLLKENEVMKYCNYESSSGVSSNSNSNTSNNSKVLGKWYDRINELLESKNENYNIAGLKYLQVCMKHCNIDILNNKYKIWTKILFNFIKNENLYLLSITVIRDMIYQMCNLVELKKQCDFIPRYISVLINKPSLYTLSIIEDALIILKSMMKPIVNELFSLHILLQSENEKIREITAKILASASVYSVNRPTNVCIEQVCREIASTRTLILSCEPEKKNISNISNKSNKPVTTDSEESIFNFTFVPALLCFRFQGLVHLLKAFLNLQSCNTPINAGNILKAIELCINWPQIGLKGWAAIGNNVPDLTLHLSLPSIQILGFNTLDSFLQMLGKRLYPVSSQILQIYRSFILSRQNQFMLINTNLNNAYLQSLSILIDTLGVGCLEFIVDTLPALLNEIKSEIAGKNIVLTEVKAKTVSSFEFSFMAYFNYLLSVASLFSYLPSELSSALEDLLIALCLCIDCHTEKCNGEDEKIKVLLLECLIKLLVEDISLNLCTVAIQIFKKNSSSVYRSVSVIASTGLKLCTALNYSKGFLPRSKLTVRPAALESLFSEFEASKDQIAYVQPTKINEFEMSSKSSMMQIIEEVPKSMQPTVADTPVVDSSLFKFSGTVAEPTTIMEVESKGNLFASSMFDNNKVNQKRKNEETDEKIDTEPYKHTKLFESSGIKVSETATLVADEPEEGDTDALWVL